MLMQLHIYFLMDYVGLLNPTRRENTTGFNAGLYHFDTPSLPSPLTLKMG